MMITPTKSSALLLVLILVLSLLCVAGVPAQTALKLGGLDFDGVDDYAEVNAQVLPPTGDFSICVWARAVMPLPPGHVEILAHDSGSSGTGFYLGKEPKGNIRFTGTDTSVPFPKDGLWHHYAVVKDSAGIRIYVDGVLRHSETYRYKNPVGGPFRLGRQYRHYKEHFYGPIDEVSVWGTALSLPKISQIMFSSLTGMEAGLRSYWRISGLASGKIKDLAGNNDLTVHTHYRPGTHMKVKLPTRGKTTYETISIPHGRPIYALLVSGYNQNGDFDRFHFYKFANALQAKGAYVHFAWWNNLLAPWMDRPLHDSTSAPGLAIWNPYKARPDDDHQFQDDARALLLEIKRTNPHAAIVLAGHSFGGDAITRLADDPALENAKVNIDLMAPIDPVGNRSTMQYYSWGGGNRTDRSVIPGGTGHFKRFYVVRHDWYWFPPYRTLGTNIKYLYHRWQNECCPPFDALKPGNEYFSYPGTTRSSTIGKTNNVQSPVKCNASPSPLDGHGEIVGFQGFISGKFFESNPLGLKALNGWPNGRTTTNRARRVDLMRRWDADSDHLRTHPTPAAPHEPSHKNLCMVSPNMSTILDRWVQLRPIADAGQDQVVVMQGGGSGVRVTLDGSRSRDPNGQAITYSWKGPFGTLTQPVIQPVLSPGAHWVHLTVRDTTGRTHTDSAFIMVRSAVARLTLYGTGCPGTGNVVPEVSASTIPRVGETRFQVQLRRARPNAPVLLILGNSQIAIPHGGTCNLLVGGILLVLPGMVNGSGGADLPIPIPNIPSLIGIEFNCQFFVADPAGKALNGQGCVTAGLQIVIGT